jgi:site-specific DNA recombinase
VALYARVSSEEQKEGQTIDSQIAELERFAETCGWSVVGIYKDEGWSGGILGRPALDRLRDHAFKGLFDTVLINDVDRLARDVTHLGVIKRDLERHAVQVIFRKLPAEKSPTQNLMVNILGSFAEFERELIADRTRRGKRHKVEVRKKFLGSIAPYGFRYTRKDQTAQRDGLLEIHSEEASVVRQIYHWVAEDGLSARRVVNMLNRRGLIPRKGSKRWAKSTVLRVLRSEVYAGVWYFNKHEKSEPLNPTKNANAYRRSPKSSNRLRPRAEWLPVRLPEELRIVPPVLWQRVQRQLDQNTAFSPRNARHNYLLRGLVRCAGCGARFVGQPCHRKFYYRCNERCGKTPSIKERDLDAAIWESVQEALLNPELIVESLTTLNQERLSHSASTEQEEAEVKKTLVRTDAEESRLFEAYRLGVISPAQLARELERIKSRRHFLESRKESLAKGEETSSLPSIKDSVYDYCALVAQRLWKLTEESKQRLLRLLVNEVTFDGSAVKIRGVIPLPAGTLSTREKLESVNSEMLAGEIATTELASRGRNLTPNRWVKARDPNPTAQFVLERKVFRARAP